MFFYTVNFRECLYTFKKLSSSTTTFYSDFPSDRKNEKERSAQHFYIQKCHTISQKSSAKSKSATPFLKRAPLYPEVAQPFPKRAPLYPKVSQHFPKEPLNNQKWCNISQKNHGMTWTLKSSRVNATFAELAIYCIV